jgi:V/A-type H+-transporting ATPase subunit D
MAKVKLTKNELKMQRDALKRFERYLPTLQLKKQQLQLEIRKAREAFREVQERLEGEWEAVSRWAILFDESGVADLGELVKVDQWSVSTRNIAGIDVPEFESLSFEPIPYDLFSTPPWYDEAVAAVRRLIELRLRVRIIEEQVTVIDQELRVVTQRVNLFEKVKIPEARENIRRIQIYLGDQQTNAVGRAKIAKEKCRSRDSRVSA